MARRNIDDDLVRMEKRATNKFGLFLLFLVTIAIFGGGGYYIYKHREKFDWELKLPWQNDDSSEEDGKKNSQKGTDKDKSKIETNVPSFSKTEITSEGVTITIHDLKYDEKGYTFEIDVFANDGQNVTADLENVLVDGFSTETTLSITDEYEVGVSKSDQKPTSSQFRILKTKLDSLNIKGFKYLTFYFHINNGVKSKLIRKKVQVYSTIEFDNSIKGLIEMYNKNEIVASYYKVETDKDNTYIYFDMKNENNTVKKNIKIKRLVINGKLYEYTDLNEEVYCGAEKVFYITIPKKKVKKVENMSISFFVIEQNDEDLKRAVYLTNDFYKEF